MPLAEWTWNKRLPIVLAFMLACSVHASGQKATSPDGNESPDCPPTKLTTPADAASGQSADSLDRLALAYTFRGDGRLALPYHLQAAKIYRKNNDPAMEASTIEMVAGDYGTYKQNHACAAHYYEQAANLQMQLGDRRKAADDFESEGLEWKRIGRRQAVLQSYQQVIGIYHELIEQNASATDPKAIVQEAKDYHVLAAEYGLFNDDEQQLTAQNREMQIYKSLGDLEGQETAADGIASTCLFWIGIRKRWMCIASNSC
jgi:tetratricopeptide (TPR) repeat protein